MNFIDELQAYVATQDHRGCDESELAEVQSRSPIPFLRTTSISSK